MGGTVARVTGRGGPARRLLQLGPAAATAPAGTVPVGTDPPARHRAAVDQLRSAYAAIPPGQPVRLAKPTSNLFRFTHASGRAAVPGLDVSAFSQILCVDPSASGSIRRAD